MVIKRNFAVRPIILISSLIFLFGLVIIRDSLKKYEFLSKNEQLCFEEDCEFFVKKIVEKSPLERHSSNFIQIVSDADVSFIIGAYPLSDSSSKLVDVVRIGSKIIKQKETDSLLVENKNNKTWFELYRIK